MILLHVIASPRGPSSSTLLIAEAFLKNLLEHEPAMEVETLDLFTHDLPAVEGQNIESKYRLMIGRPIDPDHAPSWRQMELLIEQFLKADICLISSPMWNFSVPYVLKYYIDAIVQPGYLFRYNEQGVPVGLCQDKKVVCITTRGGDYSEGSPMHPYDSQELYLRSILKFIGVTEPRFIHAQPMNMGPALRDAAIAAALEETRVLAAATVAR